MDWLNLLAVAPPSLGFSIAISFSNAWKWKVKVKSLSRVWLLAIPWTAAYQGPPSMGFSRQKYWSGVPLPSLNWLQGTLIDKSSSKSLHTYTETKFHPRANKFQSKTHHANSPATQEHSPELQYTGFPKSLQTHWHLITHYWTRHCTPERRNPAPPSRTPTQTSLTRKPWQATCPTPPIVRNLHNKEEPQTARILKGHPKQKYKQDEKAEKYSAGKETG